MPTTGAAPLGRQHTYPQRRADLANSVAANKQKLTAVHVPHFRQSRKISHVSCASILPHITAIGFQGLESQQVFE